ncbi:MAG: hypothetical protein ACYDA1_10175, partial [Vulcanimicrobiaceae bacterium]
TAQAGTPGCHVVVFKNATDLTSPSANMGDIDANDPGHSGYATDANGCLTYSGAPATNGVSVVWEPSGASATYKLQNSTCPNLGESWISGYANLQSAAQALIAGASAQPACTLTYSDGVTTTGQTYGHGLVGMMVAASYTVSSSGGCRYSNASRAWFCKARVQAVVNAGCGAQTPIFLVGNGAVNLDSQPAPNAMTWTTTQSFLSEPSGVAAWTAWFTQTLSSYPQPLSITTSGCP